MAVMTLVVLNMVTMALESEGMSKESENALTYTNYVFLGMLKTIN